MAKRRVTHDEELPFVALMDTMTNVVGVLIIVLVMIAISLASSVKKVLSELPPVTVEQLQELLKQISDAKPKEDPKKVAEEMKKLEEQLKKDKAEIKIFDMDEATTKNVVDLDDLNKKLEEQKKQRELKKMSVEVQFNEIDRLKALLDSTPVYVPPPPTVVKLPNPRPMPEKAVLQRFIVVNNRVVYLNETEFMKLIVTEVEKNKKSLMFEGVVNDPFGVPYTVMERGKKVPKPFMDRKKIMAHFQRVRMSTKDIKMELIEFPNSSRLQMRLSPNPDGGDTLESLNNAASVFQRASRKFKSEPDSVVWFTVFKDSLNTYLAARDVADNIGVPVGWALSDTPYYQVPIQEFEVDFVPGKPQPPPPPGTVVIPKPKATLD